MKKNKISRCSFRMAAFYVGATGAVSGAKIKFMYVL